MEEPMELSYFDLLFTDTVVQFFEINEILGIFNATNISVFFRISQSPDMQFKKSRPIFSKAFSNADLKWAH